MPIFNYFCDSCSKHIEMLVRGKEPQYCNCNSKGKLMKKVSLPSSPKFNGSGFYVNDYGKSRTK